MLNSSDDPTDHAPVTEDGSKSDAQPSVRAEMTPVRWRKVQRLFDAVLSREPAERPAYLAQITGDDAAQRQEVESLIRSLEEASRFIDEPAVDLRSPEVPETDALGAGSRVGAYRLERLLGTGGVGRVYLASRADRAFERQVAVKVIKRGMDTDDLVRRFKSERQILAQLDHPHIGKLLDGGATDDGRPYLVMEYIDGVRINRWCADHALDVRARIELFLAVCDAVHFAHRNLVIHRDLKPGNILVSRDSEPKLLDFGIAKLLDPHMAALTVLPTAPGWRAMTPEYASPEQVRGDAVTTASDVYSLGVVLYELLTGRRPYALAAHTPAAIEKAVCQTQPRAASKMAREVARDADSNVYGTVDARVLERRIAGDLDDIVAMALEKEPDRRYPSVDQLAADLRRHVGGLPVIARKNAYLYRTSKFVLRHKLGVSVAALLLIVLMSFLTTLVFQRSQILRQRDRAEEVLSVLFGLFEISDPSRQRGETVTARSLLDKGTRDIEARLHAQPGLQGELLGAMGTTYAKLGLYTEAGTLLERSAGLTSASYPPRDPAVATGKQRLADLYFATDGYQDAERLTRESLALRRKHLGADHLSTVESVFRLAMVRHNVGAYDEADSLFATASEQARVQGYDELLISILLEHGLLARYRDDGAAERLLREALARAETFWGEDHPEVALILAQLAEVEKEINVEEAASLFARALDIQRTVYREPHPDLASTLNNQAVLSLQRGHLEAAEAGFRRALDMQRAISPGGSALEAIVINNMADLLKVRGELEAATERYRESLAMHVRIIGAEHEQTANVLNNLTFVLKETGQLDEAETLLRDSLAILIETFGAEHSRVAVAYNNLGQIAQRRGDLSAAKDLFEQSARLLRSISSSHVDLPGVLQNLGTIADRRGDGEQAQALYLESLDVLEARGRGDSPLAATLYNNLAVATFIAKDYAQSAKWAGNALANYERTQAAGSPARLRIRRILARALEEQGRYAEAEPLMQRNIAACHERQGEGAEGCARHVSTLENLYTKWHPEP